MDKARRSARAYRTSQPISTATHISTTPSSSSRLDRTTRSRFKSDSPEKPIAPGLLRTELPIKNDAIIEDTINIQTRRKRGRNEELRDKTMRIQAPEAYNGNRSDEIGEDDEAVRCICGLDDYPGPPKQEEEIMSRIEETIENPTNPVTDAAEDLAGFFLQCDICKVWQHGGCVGIKNESSSPDEYFCDRCRKDLHKIFTAVNGQRYSHYLPLQQSLSLLEPCLLSFSKEELHSRGTKTGRSLVIQNANAKKRSTMNSRDAAYDEEEQISRAIEASKDVKSNESTDSSYRRGKRGRSDSEEKLNDSKRQRTKSTSPSISIECSQIPFQPESDDSSIGKITNSKKKRSVLSKTPKEKDHEKDKTRFEVTGKRNGRTERKLGEDSQLLKETSSDSKHVATNITESIAIPSSVEPLESQIISQVATTDVPYASHQAIPNKKGGRPSSSRKKKLGRNQYTKDRDGKNNDEQSSNRSQPRDSLKTNESIHPQTIKKHINEARSGKLKGNSSKVTMTDMKKRAAAILDFISRTQLEMADESISQVPCDLSWDIIHVSADTPSTSLAISGKNNHMCDKENSKEYLCSTKQFQDLSCRDMMDVLTKQLIKWQKEFLV